MKAKTKKQLKHIIVKKKLLNRKQSKLLVRSLFVAVAMISTGSLAFAIAATQSGANVRLQAQLKPGTKLANPAPQVGGPDQIGTGSWYALGLPQPDAITCASTRFGRGTYLQVKNMRNGRTVTCLVNDYGPEAWTNRVIDLSRGSFRMVEDLGAGTIPVEIRVVTSPPQGFLIQVNQLMSSVMGYNLCHQAHDARYCDMHRQQAER